jgi:hypothetical protein
VEARVGHQAERRYLLANPSNDKFLLLSAAELVGQSDFELARGLGVFSTLGSFDAVPKLGAIADPIGSKVGSDDLGVNDAILALELEAEAQALVVQLFARPVSGRGDG